MNCHRIVCILTAVLAGFGISRAGFAQGSGGSDASGTGTATSGDSPKPTRTRQKFTIKLPDEYRAKDVDKDNQIGMYEWPKSDWAKFRTLDLNSDGFLTPQELTRKSKSKRSDPVVVASKPSGGSSSTSDSSGSETSKPGASGSSSTKPNSDGPPTALPANEVEQQAERFFKSTDKDDNSKITEEEVKKSILVRVKFEKAGIAPSYPLSKEEFIRLYVQAAGGGSK